MNWADAVSRVPPLLSAHIILAAAAIMLGLVIALPAGILAARYRRFGRVALGFASLVQTIPSLALLALFYPLLLAMSAIVKLPALGFLPSLLALGLYALLPILRNTAIALDTIDPEIIEAANGMGMTGWQKLTMVEIPLALPVIMAGIRTASVWTIGAATLSTTVGQASLGNMIFSGLQTQNWVLVLTGCISAAALALIVDGLLALANFGVGKRRPVLWVVPLAIFAIVPTAIMAWPTPPAGQTITIGAKSFSEQFILSRLIGRRLKAQGYNVVYKGSLGSAVIYNALTANDVDVYVDYGGTLWTNVMKRDEIIPKAQMDAQVADWILAEHGVQSLGALGFENAYAFAVRPELAKARNLKTIDDLAGVAPDLTLGSDIEFLERPEWASLQQAYSLNFAQTRSFSPTFMYNALNSGAADVISAFSSDGRIAANNLVVLDDIRGAIPGYNALLLVAPNAARDEKLMAVLRPLIGAIPVENMRRANLMVDGDEKLSPQKAAIWLDDQIPN